MRAKTIDDVEEMLWVLQDEIRRSEEARYDHRLHGVLLVAQGMSAPKVAQFLGDGTRTVEYWVERFNAEGLSGQGWWKEKDREGQHGFRKPSLSILR